MDPQEKARKMAALQKMMAEGNAIPKDMESLVDEVQAQESMQASEPQKPSMQNLLNAELRSRAMPERPVPFIPGPPNVNPLPLSIAEQQAKEAADALYKRPEVEKREQQKQGLLQKLQKILNIEPSKPFTDEDVRKYREEQRKMMQRRKK